MLRKICRSLLLHYLLVACFSNEVPAGLEEDREDVGATAVAGVPAADHEPGARRRAGNKPFVPGVQHVRGLWTAETLLSILP